MWKRNTVFLSGLFIYLMSIITPATASVVISSTRIIYPVKDAEVTVQLSNKGQNPVLVQSWIDDGDIDASPDTLQVPFILTPPINRIDPGKGQMLRISYAGSSYPKDRESVYWLNVLEVPGKVKPAAGDARNYLQMAFRSRIKLFLRPDGLPGSASDAGKALRWELTSGGLLVRNDSPWFVSLADVRPDATARIAGKMVPPFGQVMFPRPGALRASTRVSWTYINDYGAINEASGVIH